MSDATVRRIQALSAATPSLSEMLGDHLKELCGEHVQFFSVILAKTDKGQTLVTTAANLESEDAREMLDHLIYALQLHASKAPPPEAQAFARMRKKEDEET